MKKIKILIYLVLLGLKTTTFAQPQWVRFSNDNPTPPDVHLIGSNNQHVSYSVTLYGIFSETISTGGESYLRISTPGAGKLRNPGWPELPIFGKTIAVPVCSSISYAFTPQDSVILDDYYIYPCPESIIDTTGGEIKIIESFIKNDSVYNLDEVLPKVIITGTDDGLLRNQKVLNVTCNPFRYNPSRRKLTVYTQFGIDITFNSSQTDINVNNGYFTRLSHNSLLNYNAEQIPQVPIGPVQSPGNVYWINLTDTSQAKDIVADYLIVTDDQFYSPQSASLLKLANHRTHFNGFDVAIVNIQQVLSLPFAYVNPSNLDWIDSRKLRTFLKRVYEGQHALHTYDGRVAFICLVGHAFANLSSIGLLTSYDPNPTCNPPNPSSTYCANDYYFSCLTKDNSGQWDLHGDVFISRISAIEEVKLSNIIDKTIHNETEFSFGGWRSVNLLAYGGPMAGATSIQSHNYFCVDLINWLNSIYNPSYSTTLIDSDISNQNWNSDYTNFINSNGANIVFHYGHGLPYSWCMGGNCVTSTSGALTKQYKIEHLSNNGKYPFVISQACYTGEFNSPQGVNGIGEKNIEYSDSSGYVAYLGSAAQSGGYFTQPSEFPFTFHEKVFSAIYQGFSHVLGEAISEAREGVTSPSSQGYDPLHFQHNLLGDPALNLMAPGYQVSQNTTLPLAPPANQITVISSKVTVLAGVKLSFKNNAVIQFVDNGQLIIQDGAILELGDNIIIQGMNSINGIFINGTLCGTGGSITNPVPLNNITMSALTNNSWSGFRFSNSALQVKLNGGSITGCFLTGTLGKLEFYNSCHLTSSKVQLASSNLDINNCVFNNTNINLNNYSQISVMASITNSSFTNTSEFAVINIDHYPNFSCDNLLLNYASGTGIYISYSGNGSVSHVIENSIIHKTGSPEDISWGIQVYHSQLDILNNKISNNRYGIASLNQSIVQIKGNPLAQNEDQTQKIIDNYVYQVLSYDNSFPVYLHYNVIHNNLSGIPPLIYDCYGEFIYPDGFGLRNIRCNTLPANPVFSPVGGYDWQPTWTPPFGCNFNIIGEENYLTAVNDMNSGNFSDAEFGFKQIIETNPSTSFALASAKQLMVLKSISEGNFSDLKTYYDTTSNLHADSLSDIMADRLSARCDIQMKNYPGAITWYETNIQNPVYYEDSIYSLIDLGDTYLLMQADSLNQSKTLNFTANFPYLKPSTLNQYNYDRNEWIWLLYRDRKKNEGTISDEKGINKSGIIFAKPNPFIDFTELTFSIENNCKVSVSVYNSTGKEILQFSLGDLLKGRHTQLIDLYNIPSGIYFISLVINGANRSTIKIIKAE